MDSKEVINLFPEQLRPVALGVLVILMLTKGFITFNDQHKLLKSAEKKTEELSNSMQDFLSKSGTNDLKLTDSLKEEISKVAFAKLVGFSAKHDLRQSILEIIEKTPSSMTFNTIKDSKDYINRDSKSLSISIDLFAKIRLFIASYSCLASVFFLFQVLSLPSNNESLLISKICLILLSFILICFSSKEFICFTQALRLDYVIKRINGKHYGKKWQWFLGFSDWKDE